MKITCKQRDGSLKALKEQIQNLKPQTTHISSHHHLSQVRIELNILALHSTLWTTNMTSLFVAEHEDFVLKLKLKGEDGK